MRYTPNMDTMRSMKVDAAKLRRLRQHALMTQIALCDASGVSRDTVSRLEKGKGGAHPETIKKLGRALGVDPRELLED
jgi:transcriptional regulator with XRE-family HTH domain